MAKSTSSDSLFTQQVKTLLSKIHNKSIVCDSIYELAVEFYHDAPLITYKHSANKKEMLELQHQLERAPEKDKKLLTLQIKKTKREINAYNSQLTEFRIQRHGHILGICKEIIEISEGEGFADTNRKSAKFLGTIQLITPTEGKKVALFNERHKPLYKAVLTLRLLDRLCMNSQAPSYVQDHMGDITAKQYADFSTIDLEAYEHFVEFVKVPLVMAALIQDIGNYHPDAQKILLGESGEESPYRMLELEDRKALLQTNYKETIKYLTDGIGTAQYVGNSKEERDTFNFNERKKLMFVKELLKNSIKPREGSGNLLKVPQIYASIILSTKENYNYKLLPKVYQALYQNAERGNCSRTAVEALQKITGDFPQGYGVTYIPYDSDGKKCDRYEYAIVNQLYPRHAEQPICRTATRNLTFVTLLSDVEVTKESNLYFSETAQQFARISKERLNEILEALASNFLERKKLDLLPRCWHAGDYFSIKSNQRLWNKADK